MNIILGGDIPGVACIVYTCLVLQLLCCTGQEWTQITGIAGLSVNVQIPCNHDSNTVHLFWMINGSVYGLLHVPNEFVVCSEVSCDLRSLTIPVVQSEMDGYTFQCVGIDYNTNTHHLGRCTELSVTTLPQDGSFNGIYTVTLLVHSIAYLLIAVTLMDTVRRDVLELHYPELSVGPVNTSIGWTYSNFTCQPSVFTIEGYDAYPDMLQLSSPFLTLTSTSSVLTFPTSTIHHNITHASFYLRLLAHDVSGTACAQDSAVMYYHLNNKGEFIVSKQQWFPVLHVYVQFPLLSPFPHHLMVRGVSLFLWDCPQHMTPHLWRLCGQKDKTLLGDFATVLHLRGHLVSSLDASLPHHVTQITPLQSGTTLSALLGQVPNSPAYLCISQC